VRLSLCGNLGAKKNWKRFFSFPEPKNNISFTAQARARARPGWTAAASRVYYIYFWHGSLRSQKWVLQAHTLGGDHPHI